MVKRISAPALQPFGPEAVVSRDPAHNLLERGNGLRRVYTIRQLPPAEVFLLLTGQVGTIEEARLLAPLAAPLDLAERFGHGIPLVLGI